MQSQSAKGSPPTPLTDAPEVLDGLGYTGAVEAHHDAPRRLAIDLDVEEHLRVVGEAASGTAAATAAAAAGPCERASERRRPPLPPSASVWRHTLLVTLGPLAVADAMAAAARSTEMARITFILQVYTCVYPLPPQDQVEDRADWVQVPLDDGFTTSFLFSGDQLARSPQERRSLVLIIHCTHCTRFTYHRRSAAASSISVGFWEVAGLPRPFPLQPPSSI